jgi:hypothetical protein
MSAGSLLAAMLREARRRRIADAVLVGAPLALAGMAIAWRASGAAAALAVGIVGALALSAVAWHRARALDTRWLARRLDAVRADIEDSASLLFAADAALAPLQRLQRARLQARIAGAPAPDLRPRWSTGPIAGGIALAVLLIGIALAWPAREPLTVRNVLARIGNEPAAAGATRLTDHELAITPPRYTRLAPVRQASLDARVPERSTVSWRLRFAPQPASAALVFHDGRRIALERRGDDWHAQDTLPRSALYRIVLADAQPLHAPRPYRLDVQADRPPQVRVLAPERSLSLMTVGQRSWSVAFEAQDDYSVSTTARLRVILAQGSGENITFRERAVTLQGSGIATRRRFAHRLDLAALGFAVGDDLIVQLLVQDIRAPVPHQVRSASLILRWPSDLGSESTGLDGMVKKVLPAYFRSQRQIIIDAEALLKRRGRIPADDFTGRSDAIGVDQRLLRLRYGQFLGEESEGAPALPTNDAEPVHDGHGDDAGAAARGSGTPEGHAHGDTGAPRAGAARTGEAASTDTHDHAPAAAPAFGEESAVLEQFGHTHDHAEAATLLDPETRTTLKAALDQMWQSELHLRQGQPDRALPYAYRALGFIKQVQQASRIYLARVGPELPPIDESRRLGGDRTGLSRRDDALVAAETGEPVLAAMWQALDEAPGAMPRAIDTAALERWLRENPRRASDPLALVAAVDALRADPGCARCRRELRALLWPLLPRPATPVSRRDDAGATGARYLEALRRSEAP